MYGNNSFLCPLPEAVSGYLLNLHRRYLFLLLHKYRQEQQCQQMKAHQQNHSEKPWFLYMYGVGKQQLSYRVACSRQLLEKLDLCGVMSIIIYYYGPICKLALILESSVGSGKILKPLLNNVKGDSHVYK